MSLRGRDSAWSAGVCALWECAMLVTLRVPACCSAGRSTLALLSRGHPSFFLQRCESQFALTS
eukprot:5042418-Pyramimonas_sp.AAC.1